MEQLDQSDIVVAHFERVLSLAKFLAARRATIHEHRYDYQCFGSWTIVAGSYRHRLQFVWDGKERLLTINEAFFSELNNWGVEWKNVREVELGTDVNAEPLRCIEEFFSTSGQE